MDQSNQNKSSTTAAAIAAVVGLAAGFGIAYAVKPADKATNMASTTPTTASKAADLRVVLNGIEREHVQLAAQATKSGFDGSPNFNAAAAATLANSKSLSDAVASVYGADAGTKFNQIFDSHITFFVNYTVAAKKGDKAGMDKAVTDLNGYVDAISDFLSGANPNLPREAVKQLFTDHVGLLKATVDAYGAGNYAESFTQQHAATEQIGKIADALSGAIVKQYPAKY